MTALGRPLPQQWINVSFNMASGLVLITWRFIFSSIFLLYISVFAIKNVCWFLKIFQCYLFLMLIFTSYFWLIGVKSVWSIFIVTGTRTPYSILEILFYCGFTIKLYVHPVISRNGPLCPGISGQAKCPKPETLVAVPGCGVTCHS